MSTNAVTAQNLYDNAKGVAQGALSSMDTMATNAVNAFSSTFLQTIPISWPTIQANGLTPAGDAPAYVDAIAITGVSPASPDFSGVEIPSFAEPPEFTQSDPTFTAPTAPSTALPAAPGAAPAISAPALPSAPVVVLPSAPTLQTVGIPVAPVIDLPVFTTTLDVDVITQPTETFSYVEQPYQDDMLDALKLKLLNDLENGGYGIEPADEEGLWNRARDRELRNAESMVQEIARQAAARGFMVPPGVLNAQIAAAQSGATEKMSSVSRDIALKRADMYVENRKFTITEVREVEQMLITYFGYMQERALNVSKAMVDYGIKLFEARLATSNYKLERYKAQASVYEVALKAALAHLEEYKARIEGARASVEIERVQAEIYNIQLQGVQAMINYYNAQLGAVKTQVEIEQMRISAFKSSVEVYATQVQAKQAEFSMFESQVRAAKAPIEVFQTQVQAYSSRVDAFKAVVQSKQAILAAQIEPARLKTELYRADISKYEADVRKSSEQLRAAVEVHGLKIKSYTVSNEMRAKVASVNVETAKAQADVALASSKQASDTIIARGNQMIAAASAFGAQQSALAHTYGNVGAQALTITSGLIASVDGG